MPSADGVGSVRRTTVRRHYSKSPSPTRLPRTPLGVSNEQQIPAVDNSDVQNDYLECTGSDHENRLPSPQGIHKTSDTPLGQHLNEFFKGSRLSNASDWRSPDRDATLQNATSSSVLGGQSVVDTPVSGIASIHNANTTVPTTVLASEMSDNGMSQNATAGTSAGQVPHQVVMGNATPSIHQQTRRYGSGGIEDLDDDANRKAEREPTSTEEDIYGSMGRYGEFVLALKKADGNATGLLTVVDAIYAALCGFGGKEAMEARNALIDHIADDVRGGLTHRLIPLTKSTLPKLAAASFRCLSIIALDVPKALLDARESLSAGCASRFGDTNAATATAAFECFQSLLPNLDYDHIVSALGIGLGKRSPRSHEYCLNILKSRVRNNAVEGAQMVKVHEEIIRDINEDKSSTTTIRNLCSDLLQLISGDGKGSKAQCSTPMAAHHMFNHSSPELISKSPPGPAFLASAQAHQEAKGVSGSAADRLSTMSTEQEERLLNSGSLTGTDEATGGDGHLGTGSLEAHASRDRMDVMPALKPLTKAKSDIAISGESSKGLHKRTESAGGIPSMPRSTASASSLTGVGRRPNSAGSGHGRLDRGSGLSQSQRSLSMHCVSSQGSLSHVTLLDVQEFEDFSDVAVIQMTSARALEQDLQHICEDLNNSNKDWEQRSASLKRLRGLVLDEGVRNHSVWNANLKDVTEAVAAAIADLRSTLVREACATACCFAQTLGHNYEAESELLLPALLRQVFVRTKIIAESAHVCFVQLIRYCQGGRYIPLLHQTLLKSRSATQRSRAAEYLFLILEDWPARETNKALEKQLGLLVEAVKSGITDGDVQTRAHSRMAFWAFHRLFGMRAETLLNEMDLRQQKTLSQSRREYQKQRAIREGDTNAALATSLHDSPSSAQPQQLRAATVKRAVSAPRSRTAASLNTVPSENVLDDSATTTGVSGKIKPRLGSLSTLATSEPTPSEEPSSSGGDVVRSAATPVATHKAASMKTRSLISADRRRAKAQRAGNVSATGSKFDAAPVTIVAGGSRSTPNIKAASSVSSVASAATGTASGPSTTTIGPRRVQTSKPAENLHQPVIKDQRPRLAVAAERVPKHMPPTTSVTAPTAVPATPQAPSSAAEKALKQASASATTSITAASVSSANTASEVVKWLSALRPFATPHGPRGTGSSPRANTVSDGAVQSAEDTLLELIVVARESKAALWVAKLPSGALGATGVRAVSPTTKGGVSRSPSTKGSEPPMTVGVSLLRTVSHMLVSSTSKSKLRQLCLRVLRNVARSPPLVQQVLLAGCEGNGSDGGNSLQAINTEASKKTVLRLAVANALAQYALLPEDKALLSQVEVTIETLADTVPAEAGFSLAIGLLTDLSGVAESAAAQASTPCKIPGPSTQRSGNTVGAASPSRIAAEKARTTRVNAQLVPCLKFATRVVQKCTLGPVTKDSGTHNTSPAPSNANLFRKDSSLLPALLRPATPLFHHTSTEVRMAVVFLLVALHAAVGDTLMGHLDGLSASQKRLLNIYIRRAKDDQQRQSQGRTLSSGGVN
eukprot:Clim_evm2s154 gene=Clim_evmTU2s154